jgi:hypothetical protein
VNEHALKLRPDGGPEFREAWARLAIKQRRAEFALERANRGG